MGYIILVYILMVIIRLPFFFGVIEMSTFISVLLFHYY